MKKTRIRAGDNGIFLADTQDGILNFCRISRYRRYSNGINVILSRLAREYHLDKIDIRNGTLIDCGANIGELGIWAKQQNMDYYAFEPEDLEANCCDQNNFNGNSSTQRVALWNKNTKLKFYRKPDSADSSLFDPGEGTTETEIDARRLDELIDTDKLKRPIVLKIEAEGAEPEVLEGCSKIAPHIDYITVDCGPERGKEKDYTFVDVNNILNSYGFKIKNAQFKRVTFLYENNIK